MIETKGKEILGIVGGMGPLASAEFVKTIYEHSLAEREQESPRVILCSDPTFPDRTEALCHGSSDALLAQLNKVLRHLYHQGVSKVVICCVTIHAILPRLPQRLRAPIISLLDVIFDHVEHLPGKHLLVSSTGTRELRLFENHPRWERAQHKIIMPEADDQSYIHRRLIYPLKVKRDIQEQVSLLESLLKKYETDSFIAGCTEIHMVAKYLSGRSDLPGRCRFIDPLTILAKNLAQKL